MENKVLAWAGIAGGIVALAGAVQSFVEFSLPLKLIVIWIGALVLMLTIPSLASWAKTERDRPYPQTGKDVIRLPGRFLAASLTVVIVSAALLTLAWGSTVWFPFQVIEQSSTSGSEIVFIAPREPIDLVIISLPPENAVSCDYTNMTPPHALPQPSLNEIGASSLNPKLRLSDFAAPQTIALKCTPAIDLPPITTEPTTRIYTRPELLILWRYIAILGGLTCLAAFVFLWRSWRSDSP